MPLNGSINRLPIKIKSKKCQKIRKRKRDREKEKKSNLERNTSNRCSNVTLKVT